MGEASAPNRTSNKLEILGVVLLSGRSLAIRVQHTLVKINQGSCVTREALFLALRGGKPPHSSFLWLLWEEKGVSLTPRSASQQSASVTPDSIASTFLPQMNSWAGSVCSSPYTPRPFSSGSTELDSQTDSQKTI